MEEQADAAAGEITRALIDWRHGDQDAVNRLFPMIYREMHAMARRQLRGGRRELTLDTTALVHEAYLKFVDRSRIDLEDRRHFFGLASRAMRHIIVDHARARTARKRGGGAIHSAEEGVIAVNERAEEIVAIDQALGRLEALDERLVRLVELRFFGGLSVEETAEAMEISTRTVKRDWRKARAFLARELTASQ